MATVTYGRVSKGVFVMKGKRKAVDVQKCFGTGTGKKAIASDEAERLYLFQDLQEKVNENIQLMQSELNTKIFDDLVKYVSTQHNNFETESVRKHKPHHVAEIPTAALVTGVNTPDHASMFSNLTSLLHKNVTPYIAVLKSKDCNNLRAIMNNTVSQIMDRADMADDEEDDVQATSTHRAHCISGTMNVLKDWYKEISKSNCSSPSFKSHRSPVKKLIRHCPPIVLVLEDLECFPPTVLQDFITICSNHLHDLPLILVLGIATTVATIHNLLPQHISSRLSIEKFQAPPSSEYLGHVIQQIVMAPEFPFKLGGKSFHLLIDMFLYHDFSVMKFIQGFQAALLDHFHSHPASILCVEQSDIESQVNSLSKEQLDSVRSTISFRLYVEKQSPIEQIHLLEDDKHTKRTVLKCLDNLHSYNQCLIPVLLCLHCFVRNLPGHPLGHKPRELYGTALSQNICSTPEYTEAMSLLQALSRDEMTDKLGHCVNILENNEYPDELSQIHATLSEFRDKFQNIEHLMQEHEEPHDSQELNTPEQNSLPQKMTLDKLKEKLQEFDKKKKKLTVYEEFRIETITFLNSVFTKYMQNPSVFPLHEVFYYNNLNFTKMHINGSPRATLENALGNPHFYFARDDMKTENSAILPTLPDVCIAYKLHNECGRLINLYDWLQAFVTIVNAGSEDEENEENQKEPDRQLQARFIRAVSELEFLGFIKSTKRKTDHVARLTWGTC